MILIRRIDLKLIIYFDAMHFMSKAHKVARTKVLCNPLKLRKTSFSRILGAITLLLLLTSALEAQNIKIFAASDLKFALDDVKRAFLLKHSGDSVEIVYGSSGKGVVQISNGAPFDLFFSADMEFVRKMYASGDIATKPLAYAKGRVVIWSAKKEFDPKAGVANLSAPWVGKIAIANPAHAPYGQKAVESLKSLGLYDAVASKLVMGENISQAANFIASENADIGIIALSLALSPAISKGKQPRFVLIDEKFHVPLIQGYGITAYGSKNPMAQEFYEFMQSAEADVIMKKYGFGVL